MMISMNWKTLTRFKLELAKLCIFIAKPFRRCQRCQKRGAIKRRQLTAYCDDLKNFATLCPQCQEDTDEYWQERWDEYRIVLIMNISIENINSRVKSGMPVIVMNTKRNVERGISNEPVLLGKLIRQEQTGEDIYEIHILGKSYEVGSCEVNSLT